MFGWQGLQQGRGAGLPYLGQIATRSSICNYTVSTAKQFMARKAHFARDRIEALQIGIPNWYIPGGGGVETGTGNTAAFTASIEHEDGTLSQRLFSGSASGSTATATTLWSDTTALSKPIPRGSKFFVNVYGSNPSGLAFINSFQQPAVLNTAIGDAFVTAASGLPDLTMVGGSFASPNSLFTFAPCAIIAQTREPSVLILGDSRAFSYYDTPDASGDLGNIARSIGPAYAYINCAAPNDNEAKWNNGHALRGALAQYCSHVICEYGIVNVFNGLTAAQISAGLQTLYGAAIFTGKPIFQATLEPYVGAADAVRVTLNGLVRAVIPGAAGFFEIADQVETAGVWKPGYSNDGVHGTQLANLAIQASGAINAALIHRP